MTYRVLSAEPLLAAGATAGPVLGLETGSGSASIGLVSGGRIIASISREVKSHGADLPMIVDELLHEAGIAIPDLSAIAVGIGPGSFTGLRVGLSYAKGLAVGAHTQIVGIPSLDAIALCGSTSALARIGVKICPVLDARKGEVYTSLYVVVADALEKVVGDLVVPLDEFASRIVGEVLFVGESKAADAIAYAGRSGGQAIVVGAAGFSLRGSFVAALGAARVAQDEVDEVATLEPLYVRAPEASVKSTAVNPGEGTNGTSRGRVDPAACGS
jgi:tRNA threonylcarbamoyladenosine biosynthesis protein TsaB